MNKAKNIVTTVVFSVFILVFSILCITHTAQAYSDSERRPLAQAPELKWETIKNGVFFDEFEDYTVDQFISRDFFRSVKAHFQMSILNTKENNDLAVEDGYIAKIDTSLNGSSIKYAAEKFSFIYEKYLKDANTNNFISIVPDKGYYFSKLYNYPSMDYEAMVDQITGALPDFEYIDIFDDLSLTDYYKTDTHWSQDKLGEVVKKISQSMGFYEYLSGDYTVNQHYPFHGVYYGQSALYPDSDTLYYLTNDILNACTVYDYETGKKISVYDLEKLTGADPYETFLSGSKALLRIDNPNAKNDKQLIVFRDSYGSSLTPLLAEGYSSIIVVDIRYVNSAYLGNFIKFDGQDVLFLYSSLILNNSFAFK